MRNNLICKDGENTVIHPDSSNDKSIVKINNDNEYFMLTKLNLKYVKIVTLDKLFTWYNKQNF